MTDNQHTTLSNLSLTSQEDRLTKRLRKNTHDRNAIQRDKAAKDKRRIDSVSDGIAYYEGRVSKFKGRTLCLHVLDTMLKRVGNPEKLEKALQSEFDADPVKFLKTIVYPVLPKVNALDLEGTESEIKITIKRYEPDNDDTQTAEGIEPDTSDTRAIETVEYEVEE